ncbi:glycosyltransferase [Corticibacterium sp. UT-5YL-CI-8]|nr:glycosyltransferase [Tianweitania sp. UT-5YL-CI-8]
MPLDEDATRRVKRIVVISDFCDGNLPLGDDGSSQDYRRAWLSGARGPEPTRVLERPAVVGGYLERLPLSMVNLGFCDAAEIWSFYAGDEPPAASRPQSGLIRRSFRTDARMRPFASNDVLGHIAAFGAPDILCVWGLGVEEEIMRACESSVKIYNSIDAPALRIPPEVSRHFDLVLTGAEWQSLVVKARHPDMATAVMPIGPEFASPDTFHPLGLKKVYDVIYVAAAQAYKRHDILFEALAKLPYTTQTLCVCGYGELGDSLRSQAANLGISVDFVGPPGVDFVEVNRLMNLARMGVVCGVDDGAPAILTEYMLANLPVLANAALTCGLQYITPLTGRTASSEQFHRGLSDMLANLDMFQPREEAVARWSWQTTVVRFVRLVEAVLLKKADPQIRNSLTLL